MSDGSVEQIDEELTAYLDGELTASDASELERRLVSDERLRTRLAELRRSYELLDELPETPQSRDFTKTTIEMVVADIKRSGVRAPYFAEDFKETAGKKRVRHRWLSFPFVLLPGLLMVLLGSGAGVLLSSIRDHRETQLLDLAVVMPGLQDVGEFRVVTELAKEKEIVDYLMSHYSDRVIPFVPERAASRRDWAFQLNALQTAKLQSTKELLLKYPADQFNRLRALQNQIDRDEDAEDCNRTLKVVGMVIDSLPTSKRQDLEGMSTEQRIRFLKEQLCLRAATFYAADLQGSDADNLEQWSREILLPAIAGNVPFLRRETDAKTAMMTLNYTRPVEDGYRLENQDALIKELTSNLSPFPKRLLEGLDRSDELLVLSTWLIPEGVNNTARLLETYDRLRRETRDEIDLADPKDARRTLRERSRRVGAGNRNTR